MSNVTPAIFRFGYALFTTHSDPVRPSLLSVGTFWPPHPCLSAISSVPCLLPQKCWGQCFFWPSRSLPRLSRFLAMPTTSALTSNVIDPRCMFSFYLGSGETHQYDLSATTFSPDGKIFQVRCHGHAVVEYTSRLERREERSRSSVCGIAGGRIKSFASSLIPSRWRKRRIRESDDKLFHLSAEKHTTTCTVAIVSSSRA